MNALRLQAEASVIRHNGITARFVLVTPELASEWLSTNQQNRNLKPKALRRLVKAFAAGRYKISPDAIAFDVNGILVNGQHRLTAVKVTGIAQWFIVVDGLPPETRRVTDQGTPRTGADMFQIGGVESPKFVASILNAIRGSVYGIAERQMPDDLELEREKYREGLSWALSVEWSKTFGVGPVVGPLVFVYPFFPNLAETLRNEMESGNIPPDQPATRVIRDYIIGSKLTKWHVKRDLFGKFLAVIWHRVHGRSPKAIRSAQEARDFFVGKYGV